MVGRLGKALRWSPHTPARRARQRDEAAPRQAREGDERVGEVNDILIAPDKSMAYAIIGVGRFLGIGERQVAVPFM
jgi:hypothetical protein